MTAAAPQAEQATSQSTTRTFRALDSTVMATAFAHKLALGDKWQIGLSFGDPSTGEFARYITAIQARELAAALIAAADHYDAETARLGGAA